MDHAQNFLVAIVIVLAFVGALMLWEYGLGEWMWMYSILSATVVLIGISLVYGDEKGGGDGGGWGDFGGDGGGGD